MTVQEQPSNTALHPTAASAEDERPRVSADVDMTSEVNDTEVREEGFTSQPLFSFGRLFRTHSGQRRDGANHTDG